MGSMTGSDLARRITRRIKGPLLEIAFFLFRPSIETMSDRKAPNRRCAGRTFRRIWPLRSKEDNSAFCRLEEDEHYGANVLPKSGRGGVRVTRSTTRFRIFPPSSVPSRQMNLLLLGPTAWVGFRTRGLVQNRHPRR
ncbi:hypothetical protein EVAR_72715_1 [Eumeta japonica]|uniref:Uncharacterized protein n=1 Tax=Eumeta variegata TaxID=151549 RepID=A0A4C1SGK2_EUMVA|nr:hypothetical protein EVAR_72715_1 [Eumeta japonica]